MKLKVVESNYPKNGLVMIVLPRNTGSKVAVTLIKNDEMFNTTETKQSFSLCQ